MKEAEGHCQQENFKEGSQNLGVGEAAEEEGEEGGDAAVDHSGPDGADGGDGPVPLGPAGHHEGQGDVDGVVNT